MLRSILVLFRTLNFWNVKKNFEFDYKNNGIPIVFCYNNTIRGGFYENV